MTLLAQMIKDRIHGNISVQTIDLILKTRNRILKEDDNQPGFNRDTVGYYRGKDGEIKRYTQNNPR